MPEIRPGPSVCRRATGAPAGEEAQGEDAARVGAPNAIPREAPGIRAKLME